MGRLESKDLDIESSVATGDPDTVPSQWEQPVSIHFCSTGAGWNATVKVLLSGDGTNFTQFGSDVTAPIHFKIDVPFVSIKLQTTAFVAGTLKAIASGRLP